MGKNAIELEWHVRARRSPADVIVSATNVKAETPGLGDHLGILETGKLADLIVVDGGPLRDITILHDATNISLIFKDGKQVPRLKLN